MDLSKEKLAQIIGDSKRFYSPFEEPENYYLYGGNVDEKSISLYYEKLSYAVKNSEHLIESAFCKEYYELYGINKNLVRSSNEMRNELIFDSFVLYVEDGSIGSCLTNERFMFGHFIEVRWNIDWTLRYRWID